MLYIDKGILNTLIVTVTEKQTIDNAYYLLSFKNLLTNDVQSLIVTNTSAYPDRYNEFAFTEGTDITINEGQNEYKIYAQTSSSNTDPDLADEELEVGIAQVGEISQTITSHDPVIEYKQHNG